MGRVPWREHYVAKGSGRLGKGGGERYREGVGRRIVLLKSRSMGLGDVE